MSRRRRPTWSHVQDLPLALRATLDRVTKPLKVHEAEQEAAILRAIRAVRVQERVDYLVPVVCQAHPDLPLTAVFEAVALHTGLTAGHVRNLYYRPKE